jgi:hypothetical protein
VALTKTVDAVFLTEHALLETILQGTLSKGFCPHHAQLFPQVIIEGLAVSEL